MQPLALEVVLDGSAALDRRVDADANDTEAEEEEHGDPLEDGDAGALALDLGHPAVPAVLAGHFLRAPPRPFLLYLFQSL